MLFEKMRNNCRDKKSLAMLMAFVVMMSMLTMGAIMDKDTKNVTLVQRDSFNDFETAREIVTRCETVEELFEEQGIETEDDDIVNAKLSDKLYRNQIITVEKTKMIEVIFAGTQMTAKTPEKNVEKALEVLGIAISENDIVSPEPETEIDDGMIITVKKIEFREDVILSEIPYETVREDDPSLPVGQTVVRQEGKKGTKKEVWNLKFADGVEESRELISETVETEPINETILVGTMNSWEAAGVWQANAAPSTEKGFSYSRVISVNATAYDPSPETNSGYSITALGMVPQYGIVAVDPNVIPLGTKLYIESSDGGASWTYGYCIAGDTGGAIKGNRVDLCYNTKSECIQFGRRSATVYVLN